MPFFAGFTIINTSLYLLFALSIRHIYMTMYLKVHWLQILIPDSAKECPQVQTPIDEALGKSLNSLNPTSVYSSPSLSILNGNRLVIIATAVGNASCAFYIPGLIFKYSVVFILLWM